ncbi:MULTISPECIES: hypothetical protein [unclassified Streptomyces]
MSSLNDKLNANSEESILEAADAEIEELSNQSRPMLISEINEA